ncbi:hypothetical protein DPEC_G00234160 [Dallia pectoralis]|uniref:Uncharacterized protein n=1 Tax=Dallia pectoralis TaxID=75939 RepID=A0ACC2FXI3_DALPE|nr:hypothetical protein DPEC_G00234160 [Dallia pectoralis]
MEDRSLLQSMPKPPQPSTPVLVISKLIVAILPIAQIVLGVLFLDKCPQQHYIPIYLVVSGAFTLTLSVLSCLPCTKQPEDGEQSALSTFCTTWNSLVSMFLFCWFIAGNVWIYSIYPPNYNDAVLPYCDKTLYLFAFWTTTLVYIFIGVILAGGCCVLLCMCFCSGRGLAGNHEDV